jgi:hypothetical protein
MMILTAATPGILQRSFIPSSGGLGWHKTLMVFQKLMVMFENHNKRTDDRDSRHSPVRAARPGSHGPIAGLAAAWDL